MTSRIAAISMVAINPQRIAEFWGAVLGSTSLNRPEAKSGVTVREIGLQLMGAHADSLLIVGLLLTVALLGAVVIAASDRPDGKAEKR